MAKRELLIMLDDGGVRVFALEGNDHFEIDDGWLYVYQGHDDTIEGLPQSGIKWFTQSTIKEEDEDVSDAE